MRSRDRLELHVTLWARPAPPEGVVDPPFRWDDILRSPRPGERERGPPARCFPGSEMLVATERVENPVLVSLGEDGRILVEDVLCVTTRALVAAIDTERALVGMRLEGARAAAQERATVARAGAVAHAREGSAGIAAAHRARALGHGATARVLAASRALTRGVVSAPDRLLVRARRAVILLSTPDGRRVVRHGMRDPSPLTAEQKAVTLTVGVGAIVSAVVVLHFAVTLAAPHLASPWRTMFFLFGYAFVTSLGITFPIEPVLLGAALRVGTVAAIVVAVVAKVLAAWMVFFLGDEVHDRLRARSERSPRFARGLAACERFAGRFGLFAVAAFIATPGLPDAIALYVFGSLQMRMSRFLAGVAIGGTVLYTALTFGLIHLVSWF